MKKTIIVLAILLSFSIAAQAQVTSIGLHNNTSYVLTFKLHIDVGATGICGNGGTYTTTLNPGASVGYTDPSFLPGGTFSSSDQFQAVQVYTNPTCGATAMVWECTGSNNYTSTSNLHDISCNIIGSTTVDWITQPGSAAVVEAN